MSYLHFRSDGVYFRKHPITFLPANASFRRTPRFGERLGGQRGKQSMAPRGAEPRPSSPSDALQDDGARVVSNQKLVLIAERELAGALAAQERPSIGMYAHPSRAETAAFERAVQAICREAHHLDLRAEELLIGIKQAWFQLAPVRMSCLGERDGDVLREVVSSSIEVFFESREMVGRDRQP
jgi:hypothetical protein